MKAFLIVILSFSFTLGAFGQQDSGFTNIQEAKNLKVNGLKEGKWIQYYKIKKDSEVETKSKHAPFYHLIIYKAGTPVGIIHGCYKSGELWSTTPYINGKINGIKKVYTKNGELMLIDTVAEYKEHGIVKLYKGGKVDMEIIFSSPKDTNYGGRLTIAPIFTSLDGVKQEEFKVYYEDGKLKSLTIYSNNHKGVTTNYNENGNEIK